MSAIAASGSLSPCLSCLPPLPEDLGVRHVASLGPAEAGPRKEELAGWAIWFLDRTLAGPEVQGQSARKPLDPRA